MSNSKRIKKGLRNRLREARKNIPPVRAPKARAAHRGGSPINAASVTDLNQQVTTSLKDDIDELALLIADLHLGDLVTLLISRHMIFDPNDYVEARDSGGQAIVEYLLQVRLRIKVESGKRLSAGANEFERALKLGKSIILNSQFKAMMPGLDAEGNLTAQTAKDTGAEEVFGSIRANMLVVRNDGYQCHGWATVHGLFDPFAARFRALYGFSIDEIQALEKSIAEVMTENFAEVKESMRGVASSILDQSAMALEGKEIDMPTWVADEINALSEDQRERYALTQAFLTIEEEVLCPYSFEVEQVADRSGLEIEVVRQVLNFFSISPGDVAEHVTAPKLDYPLRIRPIIKLGDSYVLPCIAQLLWALQARLETQLAFDSPADSRVAKLKQKYDKHRGEYLESAAIRLISSVLPSSTSYQTVDYLVQTPQGQLSFELDGLILFDRFAILIEAKAGGLTQAALDGRPVGIANRLRTLIGDAHEQVVRAVDFILNEPNPQFIERSTGHKVPFKKGEVWTLVPLTVSLQQLGDISSKFNDLIAGGFGPPGIRPWAVTFHDLQAIIELVDRPAVLFAYIRERLFADLTPNYAPYDELHWFGYFLKSGLQFDHAAFEEADRVQFAALSGIDDYFMFKMGQRSIETPKPTLEAHPVFLQLLDEVENAGDPGRFWLASRLLACSNLTRQTTLADALHDRRSLTERDGKSRDFSLFFRDGGLTVVSATTNRIERAMEMASSGAELKKYQGKGSWFMFMSSPAQLPTLMSEVGVVRFPWKQDRLMIERIRRLPSANLKIKHPPPHPSDKLELY